MLLTPGPPQEKCAATVNPRNKPTKSELNLPMVQCLGNLRKNCFFNEGLIRDWIFHEKKQPILFFSSKYMKTWYAIVFCHNSEPEDQIRGVE